MKRLLQRLLSRQGGGPPQRTVCYLRENGPIAYAADLFSTDPRATADTLLASGFQWGWRNEARGWTELTRVSLSALLADLASGNVFIAGVDGDWPADISDAIARDWILRFCREEDSPLALAVRTGPDGRLLFVPQQAGDRINALLDALGIDKASAERKAYARLDAASLEGVARSLAAAGGRDSSGDPPSR